MRIRLGGGILILGCLLFGQPLFAAPPGLIILERAEQDLEFFRKEFQGILRSVGPTSEGQRMQILIQRINGLQREIWLAKKLLLLEDAVQSEEDKSRVKFLVQQNFDEIIAHVKETVLQIKATLRVVQRENLVLYRKELIEFLNAYIEGLEYVKSTL